MSKLTKKNVNDLNVKGRRVLVRCDFNVPIRDGKITNDKRIVAALPTINKLIENGAKVILCSHLGKPKNGPEDKFSLGLVGGRLSELLGRNVIFAKDDTVIGDNARKYINEMQDGDIILLENTRFRAEETKNGEAFSRELAEICDDYVNDAFGSAHRAHCSTAGVTDFVKGETAVGFLMEKEIEFLGNAVENPERPFVAILGGAKVADKLNVISNLLEKCDTLIIGGGMAYTFMKALGGHIGDSLVDDEKLEYCREMKEKASNLGKALLLPLDNVIAKQFPNPIDAAIEIETIFSNEIPDGHLGLDIGEKTREVYKKALSTAKTIVWNGPMGVFENPLLARGTLEIAEAVAEAGPANGAVTIIGGGDSVAAVTQLGFADKMSHISTGGGASLEYLEGKILPGIKVIQDK